MRRPRIALTWLAVAGLTLTACSSGGDPEPAGSSDRSWDQIVSAAKGQTVDLWMWGGDENGNAYVDDVLAPAAKELGVTLRRVPIADTREALNRVLSEKQAGRTDGDVDLVWVNGDNFAAGRQADAWLCEWTDKLPNMQYVAADDLLVTTDFGTPVDGCEAPWHKAQFTLVYNADRVEVPPTTLAGVLEWAKAHPGRFTYPSPPDFTGSVFVRQVLYSVAGGHAHVPAAFDEDSYDRLTPGLWDTLDELAPSLWREGRTYPRDSAALDRLFADGEVDLTMTYGPATLTDLVAKGTFPSGTTVLPLEDGTVGNASFLGIPAPAADSEGAMVVANLALSPAQQAAKADPGVWGQFTVLDTSLLDPAEARVFDALPESAVVPPYDVLSRHANPELSSAWVPRLDEGWRREVLGAR